MTTVDLTCNRGDTAVWNLAATKDDNPVDLTDGRVVMGVRRNWASPMLFELSSDAGGGITIGDPATTGHAEIKLKPEDTMVLPNEELSLVYTVHVITADGDQWLVARGKFSVSPIAWDGVS